MARALMLLSLTCAMSSFAVRPSRADVVFRPRIPAEVAACEGRRAGSRCTVERRTGTCIRRIWGEWEGGLLGGRRQRLECVQNREITVEMRACVGLGHWTECSVPGRFAGHCVLENEFLECAPVPDAAPPP